MAIVGVVVLIAVVARETAAAIVVAACRALPLLKLLLLLLLLEANVEEMTRSCTTYSFALHTYCCRLLLVCKCMCMCVCTIVFMYVSHATAKPPNELKGAYLLLFIKFTVNQIKHQINETAIVAVALTVAELQL